jgi:hypothetical protein
MTPKKKIHQLLLVLFVLLVFAGCAQTIPYKGNLQIQPIPSEERIRGKLKTLMSEKLKGLVVTIKPVKMPGATSYKFQVGQSMQTNYLNTLGPLFQDVKISAQTLNELSNTDYFLEVQLINYDFHIAPSIFGTHTAKLEIKYSFYDTNKAPLFTMTKETNGSSASTGVERWGRVFIPGEVVISSGYRNSIGRAYDEALAKSIDELIKLIQKTLIR